MNWTFSKDRITALREAHGLSQDVFAKSLGTSKQHVSRWETGDLVPHLNSVLKIINLYNLQPTYFFVQTDYNYGNNN